MPAQLPGLYWDEARNRYFPLSSKPKETSLQKSKTNEPHALTSATTSSGSPSQSAPKRKRALDLWKASELRRTTCISSERERITHEILSWHYASTSRSQRTQPNIFGKIRSFCTTNYNSQPRRFIGDSQGWLYSTKGPQEHYLGWGIELNIQVSSEISSMCIDGPLCVTTALGPSPKISIQDLNTGPVYLLSLNNMHDIWCSHLKSKTLVLGGNEKAAYLPDLDTSAPAQFLPTKSDVFSVIQQDNLVYTGARNGNIDRFDMRISKARGHRLFIERFQESPRSSVLHLSTIGDFELFVSQMNGDLATYDLRFTRNSSPVLRYSGHVNSYTMRLGIAVDKQNGSLYAAGQDARIRGWRLNSGTPLCPPALSKFPSTILASSPDETVENPLMTAFKSPVVTMQLAAEDNHDCLWAATDEDLYQYHMGQQHNNEIS